MFDFLVPGSPGYGEAVRRARAAVAARAELRALASGPMLEFDGIGDLRAAIYARTESLLADRAAGNPGVP